MILVYTGDGKGKTSAAMGGAFRALGHGWRVLIVQFVKGEWPIVFGEKESAKRHPRLEFLQMGLGFVKIMGDKKPLSAHRAAAARALELAAKKIASGRYGLVVLDEVFTALNYRKGKGLFVQGELVKVLKKTPPKTHLILTGRNAPGRFIKMADLVTEMKEIKHPFQKRKPAIKGIDY